MPARSVSVLFLVACLLLPGALFAQADYSRARSHFPNPFAPYVPKPVPPAAMGNTPRIDQLVVNGEIHLSLNDALALALENNLDLVIARYNLAIADTDVMRSKAGSSVRGVATGLVQGTPGGAGAGLGSGGASGGGGGSGPGGTGAGSGGAATGSSGLVTTTLGTGATIESFDPVFTTRFNAGYSTFPTTGIREFAAHNTTADFAWSQAYPTGTSFTFGIGNTRATTTSLRTVLSPELGADWNVTVRQRLLSGFGLTPNLRFLRIARNNREIADVAFRNQVIATITQVQNIYWDLVNAYEEARVRERSVGLAEKTLNDTRAQVEAGSIAPIETARAESELAARRQELIVARSALQLQQLLMKNAITKSLKDSTLGSAPVIPTSMMQVPEVEPVVPIQDLIAEALGHRAEVAQARIDLKNRGISKASARNALLPRLDLVASYGGTGLSGQRSPLCPAGSGCGGGGGGGGGGGDPSFFVGGVGTALGFAFSNDFPNYAFGIELSVPIKNRPAQADQVRSELEYRQAEVRLQQLENQIGIEVRNANYNLEQSRALVEAALKGREFAQRTLEAEFDKQSVGASTGLQMLLVQRDLVQAETALVSAMTAYQKSRVELDRVLGVTLDRNRIQIDDAERGLVQQAPAVPGVVPRTTGGGAGK